MKPRTEVPQVVIDFVHRFAQAAVLREDGMLVAQISAADFNAFLAEVAIPFEPSTQMPPSAQEQKFAEWMQAVDQAVWNIVFCSVYDLPDYDYRSLFAANIPPLEAAQEALEAVGLPQFGSSKA